MDFLQRYQLSGLSISTFEDLDESAMSKGVEIRREKAISRAVPSWGPQFTIFLLPPNVP